ncbi:secretin N-terminal domain-containing protein [Aquabacterium sp.]|uniref:secretin N-terminal domain-containing protein n=1 Tax=Aquabacterium sp. TaxID=1872578 RepID=UPI0035AD8BB9
MSLLSCLRKICLLALLVSAGSVWSKAPSASINLNFPDTDVSAVARAMAAIVGKQIMVDPRVSGKVSLYTDVAVTPAQAYALFTAALRGRGYAVVEADGLLKVVPEAEGKLQGGLVLPEGVSSKGREQIATQIFPIRYENASNLVTVLRPLISPNNTINVNPGTNTLIITDYLSNLARLKTLLAALDTPSATDVEVIPLRYTQASDLAVTIRQLTEGAASTPSGGATAAAGSNGAAATMQSGATVILADPHINALLVRAPNQSKLAMVRTLVARLDQPGGTGAAGSNIHVVYLKNAEATRLVSVLKAAFTADGGRSATNTGAGSGGGTSSNGTISGGNVGSQGTAGITSMGNSSSTSSGLNSAQATAAVAATAQPITGGYIQADPASNALIITASEALFREMRGVIDMLDTPRAQIYVESLVVEVAASHTYDVGVQWAQIFNISKDTTLTLGTIASAVESLAGTNVLSTANLITLDNEEAKIVVGQNVPVVTGSYTSSSSSSSNPFQTIERKDVGITLRIRPQIGENGTVRMTIYQESSSVSATAAVGTSNSGVTTNTRSIETKVVVKDGKIIVLGGLLEDSNATEAGLMPGMWDTPVIGGLFRSLSRTRKKTNLVVFLRPHIMPAETGAADQITLDRYAYIRARQLEQPGDPLKVLQEGTEADNPPLLPEISKNQAEPAAPTTPAKQP